MLRLTTILALAAPGAASEANYPYTHTNCGVRRTGSRTLDSKNPNLLACRTGSRTLYSKNPNLLA